MKRYQKLLSLIGFSGILWFLLLNEFFTPLSPKSKSIVQVVIKLKKSLQYFYKKISFLSFNFKK